MEIKSLKQIVSIVNAARAADITRRKQGENKLLNCCKDYPN